jgi:hypothetical protein
MCMENWDRSLQERSPAEEQFASCGESHDVGKLYTTHDEAHNAFMTLPPYTRMKRARHFSAATYPAHVPYGKKKS